MDISQSALNFLRQRIKLRHLRLILVLEEERSVSRTAARLCVSQAAISKTRAEIEAELGAPIFLRTNNRLELTPFGRLVLQSAKRILSELDSLTEEVSQMRSGMRGTLAIGIRSISAQPFMARAVSAFKKTHPGLTVRMFDTDLPTLLDRLAKGDISLLVGRLDAGQEFENIANRAIIADPNVVIASPGHPLVRKAKVNWRDLAAQRWALTPAGFAGRLSREHLMTHLISLNLPFPSDLVETNSLLMILTLMQSEEYLSLVPQSVGDQLQRQRVVEFVRVPPVGPTDPVCLMWRSDLSLPPAARQFRDFAVDMLDADAHRTAEAARARDRIGTRCFGIVERPSAPPEQRMPAAPYRAASSKRLPSA
ncbi:MAG: LysR family transcriptional regulator [Rhodospirillaceae bacterium]|nr:LysR family transcriptional regulator [Rhodospirillaceae bacterium]